MFGEFGIIKLVLKGELKFDETKIFTNGRN